MFSSPCSPGNSAIGRLLRSSASPCTSLQLQAKQESENSSTHLQSPGSKNEKLQGSNPTSLIAILSSVNSDFVKDSIPTLNVIPSTPVPSVSNNQSAEEQAVEEADTNEPGNNGKEELPISVSNTTDNHCSSPSSSRPQKPEKSTQPESGSGELVAVRMTIEHINDNESSAMNLKASQQFPVVTRKFRQLPTRFRHLEDQFSKEGVEDISKHAHQDISNAQPITVAPISETKCEISDSEPIKNTPDAGASFCERQVDDTTELISNTPTMPNT